MVVEQSYMYEKKKINATQVCFETEYLENVWCKIELQNKNSLIIGCLYRRPNSSQENLV